MSTSTRHPMMQAMRSRGSRRMCWPTGATPTTIHWGGYGGSWLTMDPAAGITCAYTPNRWLDGDEWLIRQAEQWQVLFDVLRNLRR